jgi:hypothetical protein
MSLLKTFLKKFYLYHYYPYIFLPLLKISQTFYIEIFHYRSIFISTFFAFSRKYQSSCVSSNSIKKTTINNLFFNFLPVNHDKQTTRNRLNSPLNCLNRSRFQSNDSFFCLRKSHFHLNESRNRSNHS